MMLTFGQYHTLTATRQCVTLDQLASRTDFQRMMVSYYIAVLLDNGLIVARNGAEPGTTCYKLTEDGMHCLAEYERQNPELALTRALNYDWRTERV